VAADTDTAVVHTTEDAADTDTDTSHATDVTTDAEDTTQTQTTVPPTTYANQKYMNTNTKKKNVTNQPL
jgi:hypothetical protein